MIIPAVDLIQGQVVRLYQGDYQQKTVYADDPVPLFQAWIEQGATRLHLVDLDGAADPTKRQIFLIHRILSDISANIQVGGGIRSNKDISAMLQAGAQRVVIGSLAVTEPDKVKRWLTHWGSDAIVLAIDVNIVQKKKKVAIHGWKESSSQTLESVIEQYLGCGLKHVICTDISRDGAMTGSNTGLYQELALTWPEINWQASGGLSQLSHLPALKHSGVEGVIIGRALLEKNFSVREAVQCWQNA